MSNVTENDRAYFERIAPDLLEIRIKPGVRIDQDCIAGIMRERMRLSGNEPVCVLVLAARDNELDIAVLGMDHYKENASAEGVRAVAICSGTLMLETLARLYAAYFPPLFKLEVFNKESDARAWLNDQVAELRRAGQKA